MGNSRKANMRSDQILEEYKQKFNEICSLSSKTKKEKVLFLRSYLSNLNKFLYEQRSVDKIDELNKPSPSHPQWKRTTPFLAIWDDYAESVLGFKFNNVQINKLAKVITNIFKNKPSLQVPPNLLPPNKPSKSLGGLTPKQFSLIRLMHALQDFSRLLPTIDKGLVKKIRQHSNGRIPNEKILSSEDGAKKLLAAFGGADSNVEERLRYIYSSARILISMPCKTAYGLSGLCHEDAKKIYKKLLMFPGLKGKKADMLLRDYYEFGIWTYKKNLEDIDIISDNRVMRIALRTGIIKPSLGKLLNSLLDEFDFQYMLTVKSTREAFRKVWTATKKFNNGKYIVSYPARLDKFIFKLGDGRGGCCKPTAMSCRTKRKPPGFYKWMAENISYDCDMFCPFQDVCLEDKKNLHAPFAIQNNTWLNIFTNDGGGGGLRGI